jgi:hypothetical protein
MKVFISHSHADDSLAYQVVETLNKAGFDVWDERQIMPGENLAARMGDALEQSEAMVVLLTPAGLQSKEVQSEIGYALGNKNYSGRVISVPWILRRFPMISLSESPVQNKEGLGRIVRALTDFSPTPAFVR